jgi:hypothetical protein
MGREGTWVRVSGRWLKRGELEEPNFLAADERQFGGQLIGRKTLGMASDYRGGKVRSSCRDEGHLCDSDRPERATHSLR